MFAEVRVVLRTICYPERSTCPLCERCRMRPACMRAIMEIWDIFSREWAAKEAVNGGK